MKRRSGINKGRETEPQWDNSYLGPFQPKTPQNGFYSRRGVVSEVLGGFEDLFGY